MGWTKFNILTKDNVFSYFSASDSKGSVKIIQFDIGQLHNVFY